MATNAPVNGDAGKVLKLSATYSSPTNEPFVIAESLQTPATEGVEDKTKYLKDLRKATSLVQEQVNRELTQRMEEDKAREAATQGKPAKKDIDEEKEEENYGEEVAEEEE